MAEVLFRAHFGGKLFSHEKHNCGSSLELNHNSDSVRFENTCLNLEIGKVSKFSLQKLWLIFTFGTVCICKHLNHSICSMLLTRNDC